MDHSGNERPARQIQIVHQTRYRYELADAQSWQLAHLRPRHSGLQRLLSHGLEITPRPDWVDERTDYFGNPVTVSRPPTSAVSSCSTGHADAI